MKEGAVGILCGTQRTTSDHGRDHILLLLVVVSEILFPPQPQTNTRYPPFPLCDNVRPGLSPQTFSQSAIFTYISFLLQAIVCAAMLLCPEAATNSRLASLSGSTRAVEPASSVHVPLIIPEWGPEGGIRRTRPHWQALKLSAEHSRAGDVEAVRAISAAGAPFTGLQVDHNIQAEAGLSAHSTVPLRKRASDGPQAKRPLPSPEAGGSALFYFVRAFLAVFLPAGVNRDRDRRPAVLFAPYFGPV